MTTRDYILVAVIGIALAIALFYGFSDERGDVPAPTYTGEME